MTGKEMEANKFHSWDIIKSKIILKVTGLKTNKDNGKRKVVDTKILHVNGKEFKNSLTEDFLDGIEHKVEIVNEEPKKFVMNQIFIRADGKMAWTFVEID